MKKVLIWIAGALVLVLLSQMLFISKIDKTIVEETYQYCKKNGYSTDYCFFVDFSKPSGINRFFIYSFKEKKIIHRSLCAQGLGPNYNIFTSKFSNKIGSNYSSLGKYRVGALRKMYSAQWCDPKGYNLYGLDSTNSNALARGILIHNGNLEIQTYPLPCLPVSHGCFAVSNSMMEHIKNTKKRTQKPILLYAYK